MKNTFLKFSFLIALPFLFINCSTTQLIDTWKSPEIATYEPSKVLIVGMTSNIKARKKFERRLKDEYQKRKIEAVTSLEIFDPSFTTEKKTEAELKEIENALIAQGFDTVLFSKVIGVEDKIIFSESYGNAENTGRRFKDDYYMYQDIYYNPDYYQKYKIYHAESSLYCLCSGKDRALIWKGYIDIIDPKSVKETVDDYVNLLLFIMQEEQLIKKSDSEIQLVK